MILCIACHLNLWTGNNYYYCRYNIIIIFIIYHYYYYIPIIIFIIQKYCSWLIICDVSSCDDTLRQSFHFNFKRVCVPDADRWIAWGNVKRANGRGNDGKRRGVKNRLRRGRDYRAAPRFVKDLVGSFQTCGSVTSAIMSGLGHRYPEIWLPTKTYGVEKVPKASKLKNSEWARLWQKVCLHRLWWCWKVRWIQLWVFPTNFHISWRYQSHCRLCQVASTSCPYVIIKPSVGSQGKNIIEHKEEAVKVLSSSSSSKAEDGKFPTSKTKNLGVAKRLQQYQDLVNAMEKKFSLGTSPLSTSTLSNSI